MKNLLKVIIIPLLFTSCVNHIDVDSLESSDVESSTDDLIPTPIRKGVLQQVTTVVDIVAPSTVQGYEREFVLNYSNSLSNKATTCSVKNLSHISVTTSCSCDTDGVCSVGVTNQDDFTGDAKFDYSVSVDKDTSNTAIATLKIINKDFISVWRTTSDGETITLPLRSGFIYNFNVDWGDGEANNITSFGDSDKAHTYADSGEYVVTMTGTMQAWYFNDAGSEGKIIAVHSLGDMGWTDLSNSFQGCSNLTEFTGANTSAVTDMSYMFHGATNLVSLDLSSFDTSAVSKMNWMFANATALTSINLSNFDTTEVDDMAGMFDETSNLTSLDISSFNTALVGNMQYMFSGTKKLESLDLSKFNTSTVTNMLRMFAGASGFTSLDLSSFDTSGVEHMLNMFDGASGLTSLNLMNWNTSQNPSSTSIFNGVTGTIYCNDPDSGGTGEDGEGTVLNVDCNEIPQ